MILKVVLFFCVLININNALKHVCYWALWTSSSVIDPNLCTHIHYSFAILDSTTLEMRFKTTADETIVINLINQYKSTNPSLKHIIALGGWSDSEGDKYSRMVSSNTSRANFVSKTVTFLTSHRFDGLDLDWKFPVCWQAECEAGPASDKQNFASLLQELRTAFNTQSPILSLSAAVNGGEWIRDKAYEYTVLNSSLDYINIMTYDNAGMWDGTTGHHWGFSWSTGIMNWWGNNINKSNLLMGVPFYGISFTLQDPNQHGIGAPIIDSDTQTYLTICLNVKNNDWTKVSDPDGPYAYKGYQWVGYDDRNQILKKGEWVRLNGFGGLFIWEISQDDINGECCQTSRPMIKTANSALFQNMSDPEAPNNGLFQNISDPEGPNNGLVQNISDPEGPNNGLVQTISDPEGPNNGLFQNISDPEGPNNGLFQNISHPESPNNAVFQNIADPNTYKFAIFILSLMHLWNQKYII